MIARANSAAPNSTPIAIYAVEYEGAGFRYFAKWEQPLTIAGMPEEMGGGTQTFQPAQITHSEIEQAVGMEQKSIAVTITARDEQLRKFFITSSTQKIRIFIMRVCSPNLAALNYTNDVYLLDSGVVGVLGMRGMVIEATVTSEPFSNASQIPRVMFTRTCNRTFGRCGVDLETLKIETTIYHVSRAERLLTVDSLAVADTLSLGGGNFIHTPTAQRVLIEWADNEGTGGRLRVRLRTWDSAFTADDECKVYPGCKLTSEACTAYGNEANFGGFPFVPIINPSSHGA